MKAQPRCSDDPRDARIIAIEVRLENNGSCPIWVPTSTWNQDWIRKFIVKQKHLDERTDEMLKEGTSVFVQKDRNKIIDLLKMALKDKVPVPVKSKPCKDLRPRLLLVYKMEEDVGHYSKRWRDEYGHYQYNWCTTNYLAIALKLFDDGFWRVCSSYPYRPVS
uniref:Uncharacterized protein n=1 Tax=Plectus sambesii TaxID=2011161 RepID=A0A914X6L8_9BILA